MKNPLNGSFWKAFGVVMVLIIQFGGIVWWASGVDEKIKSQDKLVVEKLIQRDIQINHLTEGQRDIKASLGELQKALIDEIQKIR